MLLPIPKSWPAMAMIIVLSAAGPALGDELVLVRNGKPEATIILGAEPTGVARFAAQELAHHIEKSTEARLPISSETEPQMGNLILIGHSKLADAFGVDLKELDEDGYVIRRHENQLLIMGPGGGE